MRCAVLWSSWRCLAPLTLEQVLARSMRQQPPSTASAPLTRTPISTATSHTTMTSSSSIAPPPPPVQSAPQKVKRAGSSALRTSTVDSSSAAPAAQDGATAPITPPTSTTTSTSSGAVPRKVRRHSHSKFRGPQAEDVEESVAQLSAVTAEAAKVLSGDRSNANTSREGGPPGPQAPLMGRPSKEDVLRGMARVQREEAAKSPRDLFAGARRRREAAAVARQKVYHGKDDLEEIGKSFDVLGAPRGSKAASAHSVHLKPEEGNAITEPSNSANLISFLRTAVRTQSWEEGIEAFCTAAGAALPAPLLELLLTPKVVPPSSHDGDGKTHKNTNPNSLKKSTRWSAPKGTASNPLDLFLQRSCCTEKHLHVLLSLCVGAERWEAIEALGVYFGRRIPSLLVRTVQLLIEHRFIPEERQLAEKGAADPTTLPSPWQVQVLHWLASTGIPTTDITVEVFNAILTKCEETKDYQGAFYILQSMGGSPNPLASLSPSMFEETPKRTPETSTSGKTTTPAHNQVSDSSTPSVDAPPRRAFQSPFSWSASPVAPNVVSYATFIAVLEQCGKSAAASKLVSLLPPPEKKEITASYAALIYLWSQQVLTRNRRYGK